MLGNLTNGSVFQVVRHLIGSYETRRVSKPLGLENSTVGKDNVISLLGDLILLALPGEGDDHLYSHLPMVLPLTSLILVVIPFDMMTCGIRLTTSERRDAMCVGSNVASLPMSISSTNFLTAMFSCLSYRWLLVARFPTQRLAHQPASSGPLPSSRQPRA